MDGSFSVDLVPADYIISIDGCNYAGETVTFNREFDTGIRSPFNNAGIGRLIADITNQGVSMGMAYAPPEKAGVA